MRLSPFLSRSHSPYLVLMSSTVHHGHPYFLCESREKEREAEKPGREREKRNSLRSAPSRERSRAATRPSSHRDVREFSGLAFALVILTFASCTRALLPLTFTLRLFTMRMYDRVRAAEYLQRITVQPVPSKQGRCFCVKGRLLLKGRPYVLTSTRLENIFSQIFENF